MSATIPHFEQVLTSKFLLKPDASQLCLPQGVSVNQSTLENITFQNEELRYEDEQFQRKQFSRIYSSELWLEHVFGKREEELESLYKEEKKNIHASGKECFLHGFEIGDIDYVFQNVIKKALQFPNEEAEKAVSGAHIQIVTGVDSLLLPINKLTWGGFVQVFLYSIWFLLW